MIRNFFMIAFLLCGEGAFAGPKVHQKPSDFIKATLGAIPATQAISLSGTQQRQVRALLGKNYKSKSIRYWTRNGKTAFILEEIGKTEYITTGIVVKNRKVEAVKVLVYRESHGWEVARSAFTNQFRGTSLKSNSQISKTPRNIAGATLSGASIDQARPSGIVSRQPEMTEAPQKRRRHFARKWHRWIGLVAAFPLLWLAMSGVLLNHAQSLGLNDRMVKSGWVLRHYNQLPEGDASALRVGDRLVTEWGGELFLDEKTIPLQGKLVGAAAYNGQLLIATPEKLAVFNGADELDLELDDLSLPATPVEAIEVIDGQLYLASSGQSYLMSEDFFSAEESDQELTAVFPKELLPEEEKSLAGVIRNRRAMPLSRVILDAHSGSLFGWPGWVITDLAAVGLVILTLLGMRLFPKRKV